MRVVILYNRPADRDQPNAEASRDVLVQVRTVEKALMELGHETGLVEVGGDLRAEIENLCGARPDIVFNLVEAVNEDPMLYPNAAGLLELLGIPFTGSGSFALVISTDKRLAKLAFRGAGLPTPDWRVYDGEPGFSCREVPPPWLVKPNFEDASVGIDDRSIYESEPKLLADLPSRREAHRGRPLLVEHYVDGREFNLSLLQAQTGFEALPVAEIDFSAFTEGRRRIVGYRAKWQPATFEYDHTPRLFHHDDSEPLVCGLRLLAGQACGIVGMRGYARVDFRVSGGGAPSILEVNANPCLSPGAGFMAAAEAAGFSVTQTVERILAAAERDR